MKKFYLQQGDSYYTSHYSIVMLCKDVDITKAKSFATFQEAKDYQNNCEMTILQEFQIVEI